MAAVTIAPSTEAMQAIRDRVNIGTAYGLDFSAEYTDLEIDPLEIDNHLHVDIVVVDGQQLNETLDVEDPESVTLRVWVRKKLHVDTAQEDVDALKLLTRQIFQQVNSFRTVGARVQVWESDFDEKQVPDKSILHTSLLFVASVLFRVEVRPS